MPKNLGVRKKSKVWILRSPIVPLITSLLILPPRRKEGYQQVRLLPYIVVHICSNRSLFWRRKKPKLGSYFQKSPKHGSDFLLFVFLFYNFCSKHVNESIICIQLYYRYEQRVEPYCYNHDLFVNYLFFLHYVYSSSRKKTWLHTTAPATPFGRRTTQRSTRLFQYDYYVYVNSYHSRII